MSTKPSSAVQVLANCVNALKSTGPRTDEGKNVSKFNARRHGLTGQFYVMSEGDETAYKAFEADILASLKPVGAYERQLAISITQDQWRLNRSRAVEFNIYGKGHHDLFHEANTDSPNVQSAVTMAETFKRTDRTLGNVALYETRLHRMVAKNENRLAELQAERRAAEKVALEELELLIRLADFAGKSLEDLGVTPVNETSPDLVIIPSSVQKTAGLIGAADPRTAEPQANGFVFSVSAVRAKMHRADNLKTARLCAERNWDRTRIDLEDLPHAA